MGLRVSDVSAGYVSDVNILNGISLEVDDSQIVTIIGPNGSGKSTLLKCIMGFVRARTGTITVDGVDCTNLPTYKRVREHGIAYVPQLDNVFGALSIRDNLRAGGQYLPRAERDRRVEELLDRYPALGRRAGSRADALSGGERQLLAVCRALMPRPRILLLDEPSAGLSPAKVSELFESIADIRDHDKVTVLIVEQNAAQALAISDVGVVLVTGRVALRDQADALMTNPQVRELYLGGLPADLPAEATAALNASAEK